MAYSKVSNKTQEKDVKYLSKDFTSYKNQLIEFADRKNLSIKRSAKKASVVNSIHSQLK